MNQRSRGRRGVIAAAAVVALALAPSSASIAATAPSERKVQPVELSPYKVVSRGWNVYWSLSFPVFGRVTAVFFREVDATSLAGRAGLREGDHLLRINGTDVKGMKERELEQLLWPSKPSILKLQVQGPGSTEVRNVELRHPDLATGNEERTQR